MAFCAAEGWFLHTASCPRTGDLPLDATVETFRAQADESTLWPFAR